MCRFTDFTKYLSLSGSIYWTLSGSAKIIYGQIWLKWRCLGGHNCPWEVPSFIFTDSVDAGGSFDDDPASQRSTWQPKLLLISVNHRTDIEFDIACDPFWSSG